MYVLTSCNKSTLLLFLLANHTFFFSWTEHDTLQNLVNSPEETFGSLPVAKAWLTPIDLALTTWRTVFGVTSLFIFASAKHRGVQRLTYKHKKNFRTQPCTISSPLRLISPCSSYSLFLSSFLPTSLCFLLVIFRKLKRIDLMYLISMGRSVGVSRTVEGRGTYE